MTAADLLVPSGVEHNPQRTGKDYRNIAVPG